MMFKIIDKKTGKEPSQRVIDNIAKKQGLMDMDIDQFAVCEDGQIILIDDCGRVAYCDMKRFEVKEDKDADNDWNTRLDEVIYNGKRPLTGYWLYDCGGVTCSCCGYHIDDDFYAENYCTNCGANLEWV